ncbi:MAG: type II toxin-antitoxin system Phd/YefM family antitoxin [Rubrobacteraceae bacterium]
MTERAEILLSKSRRFMVRPVCYSYSMITVSIDEIRRDPLGYLRRVEAGETLLVARADRLVAEIKPVNNQGTRKEKTRPAGLCAGEFTVPDDFDEPLPEEVLRGFEGR